MSGLCVWGPSAARADPGDLSLTGLECLLHETSTSGMSAGRPASWLRRLTAATQQQQGKGRGGSGPVFTLSLQQNW